MIDYATPDLFAPRPLARNADPSTSHAAAESMDGAAREHRGRIVLAMLGRRPLTIYQLAEWTGLTHVQVARRMPELEQAGMTRTQGTAIGPTGRQCRLWELIK